MKQTVPGTVLVTGGTGFIGSHLVELLIRRGYEVICLVRDPGRLHWLAGLPVRTVVGDCTDPTSLDDAIRDVSVVYHAAGITKSIRAQQYYDVNHVGTRNLLDACARQGARIRKFVLVSSLAAAGPSLEGSPVTDDDDPHPVSVYGRSKLLAEQETLGFRDRFPVVIVRPTAVYGPRDTDVFELFKWASKGIILDVRGIERYLNWCYVSDLAEMLIRAGEQEVPSGSIYFAAEERAYSTAEFQELLQRTGGVTAKIMTVPAWMGYAIGTLSEAAGAIRGKAPIVNRQKVREAVQQAWTCDMTKTRQDLDFIAQVPLEQGLAHTWKWYREQKWIP